MGDVTRDVGSDIAGHNEGLQVVRGEAGMLCDAGQHAGGDFFTVVKREDEVRPVVMRDVFDYVDFFSLPAAGWSIGQMVEKSIGGRRVRRKE